MEALRVSSSGTLGDVYITICKLKAYGDIPITMYHSTKIVEWENEIREIYSLLPNVEVKFNEELPLKNIPYISPVEKDESMIYFPNWNLKSKFDLPDEYNIIVSHSGKNNSSNMKEIYEDTINMWIENSKNSIVLLGTKDRYKGIANCINLVGKTSILDTIPIIANSSALIATEGLLSFIGLSQKIPSHIFYKQYDAVRTRIIGTPWEKYCRLYGI